MIAETRTRYNGVDTRVLSVCGTGIPIVMFHGYGDSADTWRGVLARLAIAGCRALAVDLPGFGQAGPRSAGPMVSQFDDFADAVLAGVGPALLVGNSMGAATAVRAASRHPAVVKGLVAIDDPLYARHLPARLARHAEVPTYFWSLMGRVVLPATVLRWVTGRAVRRVMRHPRADVDTFVLAHWQQSLTNMRDVAALSRYALQYACETRAAHRGIRVVCPTLVVHGKRDRIIPLQASMALHQQIPDSELVVLPRSGHCPQLDDPAEVARLVLWLLSRISGRAQGACSV